MKNQAGFTLVENLVAMAIFVMLALVIYQTSTLLIKGVSAYRESATVSSLADQYMEIVHNLPYGSVCTMSGNPRCDTLPDLPNAPQTTINGGTYQIYYVVNYVDDPADGTVLDGRDFAANDYKQVRLYIKNLGTGKLYDFTTNIVPKGLENMESGGALSIKVIDAVGQPVPGASVNIVNASLNINLTRTTDEDGNWIEVGLPNDVNGYHITATKTGYSTDATYPLIEANPNPIKADATVRNGQVTDISFAIDKLSDLSFMTLNQSCQVLPGISLVVKGAKLIGSPNLPKFDRPFSSDGTGKVSLNSVEWDAYLPAPINNYMIYGSSPAPEFNVLPNTNENFDLILGPKTENGLLVVIKDTGSNNPIEGATVRLQNSNQGVDKSGLTGGSVWNNDDWTDRTKYSSDDGRVSADTVLGGLRLGSPDNGATYYSDGSLTSATFDTGASSTVFTALTWQPTSETASTSVKFQIAVSNDDTATTTWNFTGPDGSGSSFYESSGENITAPNARYIRYKVFLATVDPAETPVLTNVSVNYISGCFTPGQVFFAGLPAESGDTGHSKITVSAPGYATQTADALKISGYQILEISLGH